MRLLSVLLLASPAWSQVRSIAPRPALLSPAVGLAAPTLAPAPIEPGPMGLEALQALHAAPAAASMASEAGRIPAAIGSDTPSPEDSVALPREEKAPVIGDLRRIAKEAAAPARTGAGSWEASARTWDKARETRKGEERILVFVRRTVNARAVAYQKAGRPLVDYWGDVFSLERARAFADKSFDLGGARRWTGREILQALMTVEGLIPTRPPDKARADLDRFGVGEQTLHALAAREGLATFRLYDAIEEAFRDGLVARLDSERLKRTFYAVPEPVRVALGLTVPAVAPALPAAENKQAPQELSAFAQRLVVAARAVEGLSEKDEIFEFTAQVAQAAVEAGLLPVSAFSEGFRAKAGKLTFETPPLDGAIATLLDSAQMTPYAQVARNLSYEAERAGLSF